jgi:cell division protein FtsB
LPFFKALLDLEEFFKQIAQFNAKINNLKKSSNNLKKEIELEQSMIEKHNSYKYTVMIE